MFNHPTDNYLLGGTFRPRIGAPLTAAYEASEREIQARASRCYNEKDSREAKVFNAVFYSAIVRKEYANEKLRNALALIRDNKKLYRHTIKQRANAIRADLCKWDRDIAHCVNSERNLDFYDALTDYSIEQLDKLYTPFYYSILQVLTKHDCLYRKEMAALECAVTLQEFAEKQLTQDVGANYLTAPQLRHLGSMLDTPMVRTAEALRAELSDISSKGQPDINLNADPMTAQAAENLFKRLGSADAINRYVDAALAPHAEEITQQYDELQKQ